MIGGDTHRGLLPGQQIIDRRSGDTFSVPRAAAAFLEHGVIARPLAGSPIGGAFFIPWAMIVPAAVLPQLWRGEIGDRQRAKGA
jgi:hypothetical protein